MSPVIRRLRPGDKEQWAALWRAYLEFYEASVPLSQYELQFTRLLGDDPRDYHAFVAEHDGKLVGLTHYLFHRHAWKVEEVIYLQDLYVDSAMRGSGLGRKLIEAVYAAGDAAGCPTVYWLTQSFNAEARRLYNRVGVETPFLKYQRP